VPANPEELRIMLGRIAYRSVQPSGIEFKSLRYNCSDLSLLRSRLRKQRDKQIKIKYHPGDLSRLYAYDPFDKKYIEVPALAKEYTRGLSLWKHEVIRNYVLGQQDTVDMEALGQAKRKIQAIVEESKQRKKLGTRAKIARWEAGGKSQQEPIDLAGATLPPSPATGFDAHVDLDELEEEGWGISYDMPVA
jgi:putative transposase